MSSKVNLDRWAPHLAAAKREGKSLAAYARERGLSQYTLYAARESLRRAEGEVAPEHWLPASRQRRQGAAAPAFATVRLAAPALPASILCAQLPNGIAVQLHCAVADVPLVSALVQTLARLPCSASTRS